MKVLPIGGRVYHFLRRQLKAPWARFATVTDPRDRRGQRWSLLPMMHTILAGILAGVKTLRQLEAQSLDLQMPGFSPLHRRLPDTTVYELLGRLAPDELLGTLVAQVRTLWRSKLLAPLGLPCGVIAIDGKSLGALDHDADGWGQRHTRDHDGSPYWLVRALRAVLTSSVGRPALWQLPIPPHTNEMGCFVAMFDALRTYYDALFEIITVDAGMTCKAHAAYVQAADKGYVMAVKDSQPELLRELQRELLPQTDAAPVAHSDWERHKGHSVQRRLYRTVELAGLPGWESLRQGWLVRTAHRADDGTEQHEDRYFISNVPVGRLSPSQILGVVRGHWGIENDCNWTLDMVLREDDTPMCTQGSATLTLGVLRLLAYNLLQLARRKHLRPPSPKPGRSGPQRSWREVLRAFEQALTRSWKDARLSPVT